MELFDRTLGDWLEHWAAVTPDKEYIVYSDRNLRFTGEVRYHDYFGHEDDLLIAEMGHYESEQYTVEIFTEILHSQFPELKIIKTSLNTNPINYL